MSEEGFELFDKPQFKTTPTRETNMSTIERLGKQYGWLFGVYVLVIGILFVVVSFLFRQFVLRSMGGFIDFASGGVYVPFDNPVYNFAMIPMVLGFILIIVGIILIIVLGRQMNKK